MDNDSDARLLRIPLGDGGGPSFLQLPVRQHRPSTAINKDVHISLGRSPVDDLIRAKDILDDQKRDTVCATGEVIGWLHLAKEPGQQIRVALDQDDLDRLGELMDAHRPMRSGGRGKSVIPVSIGGTGLRATMAQSAVGSSASAGMVSSLCPKSWKGKLRRAIGDEGLREMPFDVSFEGAKVLVDSDLECSRGGSISRRLTCS
jgi:hypothetical protein